jgi:hypothetical protein
MKKWLWFMLLCSLAACATPYQEMGMRGGVETTQLSSDTWRISARGNAFTDATKVQDFVLLRAAQLAMANGYTHFVVLGAQDTSKTETVTTPGSYTSNTHASATMIGSTAYGTATTRGTYAPPQTYGFIKPGTDTLVKLLNTPPPAVPALEAQVVYNSLAPKYL